MGVRDFDLGILWNNALFETLSFEINVFTLYVDSCSYVLIGRCIWLD